MPLASRRVPSESILVHLPQVFRHERGERFSNQVRRVITKDFRGGGVCKQDCTSLVNADHGVTGGFDPDAGFLFGVGPFGFFFFLFCYILADFKKEKRFPPNSLEEREIFYHPKQGAALFA